MTATILPFKKKTKVEVEAPSKAAPVPDPLGPPKKRVKVGS